MHVHNVRSSRAGFYEVAKPLEERIRVIALQTIERVQAA